MAASHHGDTPHSGKTVTSVPVTPYTTSVDVNAPRYSAPHGVCRLGSSLSRPGTRHHRLAVGIETTGSPVPRQRLRRAHATFTPGTARATSRQLPG